MRQSPVKFFVAIPHESGSVTPTASMLAARHGIAYHSETMTRHVKVHLLPTLFEPEEVRGGITVIIDVLRASTTITHALAHGAQAVIPVGEVAEARQVAALRPIESVLLGGEREGVLIEGFDLDNNPLAYSSEVVSGKTIIFTTSNGTKALLRAREADRIVVGSFVNLQAVVHALVDDTRPLHLVCAGTEGKISLEDVLCAGGICHRLQLWAETLGGGDNFDCNDDPTQLALDLYWFRASAPEDNDSAAIREAILMSRGGRNCQRLGFDHQVSHAATYDLFDIVPEYIKSTGEIIVPRSQE